MNPAQAHLILTHVPLLGTLFAIVLLGAGMVRESEELKRAGLFAFLLAAVLTIPTYLTGGAADAFLHKTHVDITEQHGEVAIIAFSVSSILGLFCLVGIIFFRKTSRFPTWFLGLTIVLGCVTLATMAWTANLGAQIRHPEIANRS